MGDGVTPEEDAPPENSEETTYSDIFEEVFPQYLLMGMTPEMYWDTEPGLAKAYREAYRMRKENEAREADYHAWLQGLYMRDALQSVALLVNGFVPKGVQPSPYPEKSYSEQAEAKKKEERKQQRAEAKKQAEEEKVRTAMALFQAMAAQFNSNLKKRQEKEQAGKDAANKT